MGLVAPEVAGPGDGSPGEALLVDLAVDGLILLVGGVPLIADLPGGVPRGLGHGVEHRGEVEVVAGVHVDDVEQGHVLLLAEGVDALQGHLILRVRAAAVQIPLDMVGVDQGGGGLRRAEGGVVILIGQGLRKADIPRRPHQHGEQEQQEDRRGDDPEGQALPELGLCAAGLRFLGPFHWLTSFLLLTGGRPAAFRPKPGKAAAGLSHPDPGGGRGGPGSLRPR